MPDATGEADALADANVDAASGDADIGCGSRMLGVGSSASVAFTNDTYAVVYRGPVGELRLAMFSKTGAPLATDVLPLGIGVTSIAGHQTFLAGYSVPETSVGVIPISSAGALGTPITFASDLPWQLHIEPSPTGEFALIYDDGVGHFARFASDGALAFGPIQLATPVNQHTRGLTYRPGGWALASQLFGETKLVLIDNNGVIERSVVLDSSGDVWQGGIAWTGAELLMTWWSYPAGARMLRFDSSGDRLLPDFPIPSTSLNWPRGPAAVSDGYVVTTNDSAGMHLVHVNPTGPVITDHVIGPEAEIHFHDLAVTADGGRAATWHTQTNPEAAWFAIDCP